MCQTSARQGFSEFKDEDMRTGSIWLAIFLTGVLVFSPCRTSAAPIHDAALDGDINRLEELLDGGADINAPSDAGTPLQWALFADQSAIARRLLERGADPNVEGATGTPLQSAVLSGNAEIALLLLQHGADPNRGDQSTPLIAAASKNNILLAELLLARGADPRVSNFDGVTALHVAAQQGYLEFAQLMLEAGADVNALTKSDTPPLHFPIRTNNTAMAAFLRARGAAPQPVEPISGLLATADLAEGERLAKRACSNCHSIEAGVSIYAPTFWNLLGRAKGGIANFNYSPAFKDLEGRWTFEDLNAFVAHPALVVPGTRMALTGIHDPRMRADLIAYLRTLSNKPIPLP